MRKGLGHGSPHVEGRAAVLSGGGAFGAYHIGFLFFTIVELGVRYSRFYGVSAGGLVASFMSMFCQAEQPNAIRELKDIWLDLETKDIYRKRLGGILAAAYAPSVYDSTPLLLLVQKLWNPQAAAASNVVVKVGVVCWDTGEYKLVSSLAPRFDLWTYASAAYPVFFLPAEIEGQVWGDAGMVNITPVREAIVEGCKLLDVVTTEPISPLKVWSPKGEKAFPGYLARMLTILFREIADTDLQVVGVGNHIVDRREEFEDVAITAVRPSYPLPGDSLEFVPADSKATFQRGFDDAAAAYRKGEL